MAGCPGNEGLAPRIIGEIFRLVEEGRDRYQFTVLGSMLELYRNDLIDLLQKPTKTGPVKVNVRLDRAGKIDIEHLQEEECKNAATLAALLERGNKQ